MSEPVQQVASETITEHVRPHPQSWVPSAPRMIEIDEEMDDATYRRFLARNSASQTLSLQRTEWYARSIRTYVMVAFWLGAVGAVVGIILMILLVTHTGATATTDPFAP